MVVYEEPLGMQPKVAATRAPQDPKSGTWHSSGPRHAAMQSEDMP